MYKGYYTHPLSSKYQSFVKYSPHQLSTNKSQVLIGQTPQPVQTQYSTIISPY